MSGFTLNGSPGLTEVWGSIMITKINSQLYLTPNRLASPSRRSLSQKKGMKSKIPAGSARLLERFLSDLVSPSDAEHWQLLYSCPVIESKKATQWAFGCCKRSSWTTCLKAHWSIPVFLTLLLLLCWGFSHWTEGRMTWWGLYGSESCEFKLSRLTHKWPLAVLKISWRARGKLSGLQRSCI